MVISNAMAHAVELMPANPLQGVRSAKLRTLKTVDPRAVVNAGQARRLLAAVADQGERGARMVALFGCLYYAALRPEEATDLCRDNLSELPDSGWREMLLTHAEPRGGTHWTDKAKPVSVPRSNTARSATLVECLSIRAGRVFPTTLTGMAPGPRREPSPACGTVSSPTARIRRSSTKAGRPHSPSTNPLPYWPADRTTCATPPFLPGSTPASARPRSPSGPATA